MCIRDSYYGVERPLVETVILPTTWFEVGAGVHGEVGRGWRCLLYTSDAADERSSVDLGGRRIIKKKK